MTTPLPTAEQLEAWSIDREFSRHITEAKARGAGSLEIDHLCDEWLDAVAPLEAAAY